MVSEIFREKGGIFDTGGWIDASFYDCSPVYD